MSRFGSYKTFMDALNLELELLPLDQITMVKRTDLHGRSRSSTQNKASNQSVKKKGLKSDIHFTVPRTEELFTVWLKT